MKRHSLTEAVDKLLSEAIWQGECLVTLRTPSKARPTVTVGGQCVMAYRAVYEVKVGPIPPGHDLHHTCRTPRCLLWTHMEPRTSPDHALLHSPVQTHCKRGHPFTGKTRQGWHTCRECRRRRNQEFRARKRQAANR